MRLFYYYLTEGLVQREKGFVALQRYKVPFKKNRKEENSVSAASVPRSDGMGDKWMDSPFPEMCCSL